MMKARIPFGLCAAFLTVFSSAALAVDGVVLIDQNRALAGNVTPGDAAGFPVSLSRAGSYRLSGNLTVPADTDGIVIAADDVTLDLNGFRLAGGGSGAGVSNGGTGRLGTTIRNGTVTNFESGIGFGVIGGARQSTEVQQIRAIDNADFGISLNPDSIVTGCTATGNRIGIFAGVDATVIGNNASDNADIGIEILERSLLSGNTVSNNTDASGIGILVTCPSNLVGNAALGNDSNIIEIGAVGTCTRANNNPAP